MHQKNNKVPCRNEGFNLIELIMVLVIVGILASLAMPGFQIFIGDSKISAATNTLVSSVYAARSEAIKRGTRAAVCASVNSEHANPLCGNGAEWTNGWIAFVDDNGNGVRDGGTPGEDVLVQAEALSAAFIVETDALDSNFLYFANNGTSVLQNGIPVSRTLTLKFGEDEERLISISANGRVSSKVVE